MASILNITRRAPRTGAAFSAWGGQIAFLFFSPVLLFLLLGAFSVLDCSLQAIRRKEDVWNPIIAGTLVGFILPLRRGKTAMVLGAIGGFVILSAIEGLQVWLQNKTAVDQATMAPPGFPGAGARQ